MAPASLLLAGFSVPHDEAATTAILDALSRDWDAEARDLTLYTLLLPWSHRSAPDLLTARLLELRPDLLVLMHAEPSSPEHILQVLAADWIDDPAPDADGITIRETLIDPDGPVAYRSRLPLDGIWDKFLIEHVPVRMGHKAGWSVFNHTYYRAMRCIDSNDLPTLAGAVSLPALPGQTEDVEGRDATRQTEDIDMLIMTVRHLFAKREHDEAKRRARHGP